MTAQRALTEDELIAMFDEAADLSSLQTRRGVLAVLDTDVIRTGLHYQLAKGLPPRSVRSARDGSIRLFMEYDTLAETGEKLPKFAKQLGVPATQLRRMLNDDWLPHIEVAQLPPSLRAADSRALEVRDRDAADYPAAALAALLSPCLLLTRNYKHFGVLGVRTQAQGIDGIMAVAAINIGEMQIQVVVMIPAVPLRAAVATMKWAADRIGLAAWVIAVALIGSATYWYCKQAPERRDCVKKAAGQISMYLLNQLCEAADGVYQARLQLRACVVPPPERRTPAAAILRELALSPKSLSAAQLAELLDPSLRPPLADLRAFLRDHEGTVFKQVRRGGYVLGSHYELPG